MGASKGLFVTKVVNVLGLRIKHKLSTLQTFSKSLEASFADDLEWQ